MIKGEKGWHIVGAPIAYEGVSLDEKGVFGTNATAQLVKVSLEMPGVWGETCGLSCSLGEGGEGKREECKGEHQKFLFHTRNSVNKPQ